MVLARGVAFVARGVGDPGVTYRQVQSRRRELEKPIVVKFGRVTIDGLPGAAQEGSLCKAGFRFAVAKMFSCGTSAAAAATTRSSRSVSMEPQWSARHLGPHRHSDDLDELSMVMIYGPLVRSRSRFFRTGAEESVIESQSDSVVLIRETSDHDDVGIDFRPPAAPVNDGKAR